MTGQIRLLNAFLWPFSSSTAIHGIILSNRLGQSRIAPQPGGPQITPELEMRTIPSPPDGMFIWGDTESVFIRGQALVSVISRPCCGGNAYYVVVRGPCLLWPWGLFPWRNGAPRNERSDHRKPPWEWKKEWPKHCQICKKVFSFSHLHPLFTNTFPVSHITLCLHLSGYVLIVFFFSFLQQSIFCHQTTRFLSAFSACDHKTSQSHGRLSKLYPQQFACTSVHVCAHGQLLLNLYITQHKNPHISSFCAQTGIRGLE